MFSFISSVQSSEIQLFRLRMAVEAIFCSSLVNKQLCRSSWKEAKQPRFHANIPSINLVCQQIYCRIDGILLASSKFGPGQKKKKKQMLNSIASDDRQNDFEPRLPRYHLTCHFEHSLTAGPTFIFKVKQFTGIYFDIVRSEFKFG